MVIDSRLKEAVGNLSNYEEILNKHGIRKWEIEEKNIPGAGFIYLEFHDKTNSLIPAGRVFWSKSTGKMLFIYPFVISNQKNFDTIRNSCSKKYGKPKFVKNYPDKSFSSESNKYWEWGNSRNAVFLYLTVMNDLYLIYANYDNIKEASQAFDAYIKKEKGTQNRKVKDMF